MFLPEEIVVRSASHGNVSLRPVEAEGNFPTNFAGEDDHKCPWSATAELPQLRPTGRIFP